MGMFSSFPFTFPQPWQHPRLPPNTDLQRENNLPAVKLSSYLNFSLKSVQINSIKNGLKTLFSLLNQRDSHNEKFWLDTLEVSDGNFLKWSIFLRLSLALWYSGSIIFAPFRTKLHFKMSAWRRVCLWKATISSTCISSPNKSYYLFYNPHLTYVHSPSHWHQCYCQLGADVLKTFFFLRCNSKIPRAFLFFLNLGQWEIKVFTAMWRQIQLLGRLVWRKTCNLWIVAIYGT